MHLPLIRPILNELKILYPDINYFGTSNTVLYQTSGKAKDSVIIAIAGFDALPAKGDFEKNAVMAQSEI